MPVTSAIWSLRYYRQAYDPVVEHVSSTTVGFSQVHNSGIPPRITRVPLMVAI
jgi:hypothetical protein